MAFLLLFNQTNFLDWDHMNNNKLVLSFIGLFVSGMASAATWTFNNTATNTQAGVTATASAWANTVGSTNTALESAYLGYYGGSGLGVKNKDFTNGDTNEGSNPEHAIDNDQRKDSVLFSFAGDKVKLSGTNFGWVSGATGYGDSDYSVYAYTGAGVGSVNGVTYTDAAMASAGWTLVGHYQGGSAAGNKTITSTIFSSYWLIGALNGTNDTKKDAFKLISVAGVACTATAGCGGGGTSVPAPGTLLLIGAGLLGLTRVTGLRVLR